jgi:HD superfamily phosphohydrolase
MEHSLVDGISHEFLSLQFMEALNNEFDGALSLAISIFTGSYHRKFMAQLIASQIDMDRADYLKRDSFYTGVAEGNINSERIITMLNVIDDELVLEEKGVFSIEKFLVARQFMYWQVYLHKTGIVAEELLMRTLQRAKELVKEGLSISGSPSLLYFLNHRIGKKEVTKEVLKKFALLDDYDIISALKAWTDHEDTVLSELSKMLINRQLLKIKMKNKAIGAQRVKKLKQRVMLKYDLSNEEASYFVFTNKITTKAYDSKTQPINILLKSNKVKPLNKVSNHFNLGSIANSITKYYICYPKSMD